MGQEFTFTAKGADPDGDRALLEYSFNGGSWTKSPVFIQSYSTPGAKSVMVTVRDKSGGTGQAQSVVDVQDKRAVVYYLNSQVRYGRGDLFPASSVAETGVSFSALAARSGLVSRTWKQALGRESWVASESTSYVNFDGGDNEDLVLGELNDRGQITDGQEKKGKLQVYHYDVRPGYTLKLKNKAGKVVNEVFARNKGGAFSGQGVWIRVVSHKVLYFWATKKLVVRHAYSRSRNLVILDAVTGKFLGTRPASDRKGIGQEYPNFGVVVGYAVGSEAVEPQRWVERSYSLSETTGSPVAVDLNGNGQLDLLSGGMWQRAPERALVSTALRPFKLDGKTEKLWEWISNEDGLLVYNPEGLEELEVTGENLFGNYSFGKRWVHGYEPLATLDADGNGRLEGEELKAVWVWKDMNSDAKVQKGELRSSERVGVETVYVNPQVDRWGNAMVEAGVRLKPNAKGEVILLSSWDWISYGGLDPQTQLSETPFLNMISNYTLESSGRLDKANLFFGPTREGYRAFLTLYMFEFVEGGGAVFERSGQELSWTGRLLDESAEPLQVKVTAQLVGGGQAMQGVVEFPDGTKESWKASLTAGLPLPSLNVFPSALAANGSAQAR
jgi:hypothetical protein